MMETSFRHLVLLSAFLQNLVSVGYVYGFSRIIPAFVENYQWTRVEAGLIQTVSTSVHCLLGVITGSVIQRYGPKYLAVVGVLLMAFPISLSFFSRSFVFLIFTHGVLGGIGSSFLYISAAVVVNSCYQGKSKSLALTIVSSGNGVGAMAYSYLNGYLLNHYGLSGTFLINGAIVLNAFSFILIWPGGTYTNKAVTKRNHSDSNSKSQDNTAFRHMWRIKTFVLYASGAALFNFAELSVVVYVVDIVVDRGGSSTTGSLALFLFSMTNTVGRFVPGLMSQIHKVSIETLPLTAAILALAATIAIIVDDSVKVTLIGLSVIGLAWGTQTACISVLTVKLIGNLHMPTAMGLIMTLMGIGMVISTPVMGFFRDSTGSYTVPLFISIAILVVSNALLLVVFLIRQRQRFREQPSQPM